MGDLLLLASPLAVLNLTETTVVDLWGRTDGRERLRTGVQSSHAML